VKDWGSCVCWWSDEVPFSRTEWVRVRVIEEAVNGRRVVGDGDGYRLARRSVRSMMMAML